MENLKTVKCSFNLFNEGRQYTGNHRKYVLENAKKICYDSATREKINLREAVGYYGHGRRILSGKMNLQEVEMITTSDGSKILVSNIPSNVTTQFDVAEDGTVTHTQEITKTETGQIIAELNESKIGGFSWACPGKDGGSMGTTKLTGFSGFDYVLNPGFALNRGYVLESAGEKGIDRDALLESIAKATSLDNGRVEALLNGWSAQSQLYAAELQESLEDAELFESALMDKLTEREGVCLGQETKLEDMGNQFQQAVANFEQEKTNRKELMDFVVKNSPFFIPDEIKHAMMENDFGEALGVFEKAKAIDFTQHPVGRKPPKAPAKADTEIIKGWDI